MRLLLNHLSKKSVSIYSLFNTVIMYGKNSDINFRTF
jgi:hypothetical protein